MPETYGENLVKKHLLSNIVSFRDFRTWKFFSGVVILGMIVGPIVHHLIFSVIVSSLIKAYAPVGGVIELPTLTENIYRTLEGQFWFEPSSVCVCENEKAIFCQPAMFETTTCHSISPFSISDIRLHQFAKETNIRVVSMSRTVIRASVCGILVILVLFLIITAFFIWRSNEKSEKFLLENKLELYDELIKISKRVAHDIRSPIMAMDIAADKVNDPDVQGLIRAASKRIKKIAEDILSEYRTTKSLASQTDVKSFVASVDALIREKLVIASDYKISFEVSRDLRGPNNFLISAHLDQLIRVLSNLINNSIEAYGSKSGEIKLTVNSQSKRFVIKVSDNAGGIPSDVLKKLEIGEYSTKKEGFGIGLSAAKEIIHKWGGELTIDSRPNVGTTVSIYLNIA